MSHARAGLGTQWARPHSLLGSCLNVATVASARGGRGLVLGGAGSSQQHMLEGKAVWSHGALRHGSGDVV